MMFRMNPTPMSPFLAQVRLINVDGSAGHSADVTIKPDVHAQVDAALGAVRVIADEVIEEARVAAHAALAENQGGATTIKSDAAEAGEEAARAKKEAAQARKDAAQAKDDSDSDNDGSADVTVNNGTKSVVIHHSKSHDSGIPSQVIPIVAITFTFLYLIVRALMAPFTKRGKRGAEAPVVMEGLSAEEAAILEKLQRTLVQMESRVESLETILIDPARTKEKYGSKL